MKLTLRNKILLTFLGSLLIGILVLTIVNSTQILSFTNTSADITYDAMSKEELDNLNRIAQDKALLVKEYLRAVVTDITLSYEFATKLFTGDISMETIDSYWADTEIDTRLTPLGEDVDNYRDLFGFASWEVSTIYIPGINNTTEYDALSSTTKILINQSSALDYVFKSIHASNPDYIWIYMGFEQDNLFRQLPYNDLSWAREDSIDFTDSAWYSSAINKNGLSIILDEDPDSGLVVTASIPVKNVLGDLIGVVGVDLPIDVVQNAVAGGSILDNGYAFMTDKSDIALIHPALVEDSELFGKDIAELEITNSDKRPAYRTVIADLTKTSNAQSSFERENEQWIISYADIGFGFSMFVVVPEADILAPAELMKTEIIAIFKSNLIYFLMLIFAVSVVIIILTSWASKKIVEPVNELTNVTKLITQGNLNRDLQSQGAGSEELNILYNTFRGLITALRFGNQDYYAGDINKAMNNYQSALELFKTMDNQKGIGIAMNNIANIHKARGDLKDANKFYRESITIAEQLLDKANPDDRTDLIVSLASRYNNIALLYKDIEKYDRAEQYLMNALDLDRKVDNARGFATRYGNLGQVYLAQNRLKDAKTAFDDAYEIANSKNNIRAIAYCTMNYGIYERYTGNLDAAVEKFLKAVEMAEEIDVRVVSSSLQNVVEIFEEQNKIDMAKKIKADIRSKLGVGKPKEVSFILDYSGSMTGKRIRNARRGIKNIFKQQVNSDDIVSLIIFSSNHEVLIHPTMKSENVKKFLLTVDNLKRPVGATAFYDALGYAFEDTISSDNRGIESWIIALTDGDDNSSRTYNPKKIIDIAQRSLGVNLIIIGVGNLKDKNLLIEMCKNTDKGKYIDVTDGVADAITQAFEEVSSMLSEIEVEGFVPDEN